MLNFIRGHNLIFIAYSRFSHSSQHISLGVRMVPDGKIVSVPFGFFARASSSGWVFFYAVLVSRGATARQRKRKNTFASIAFVPDYSVRCVSARFYCFPHFYVVPRLQYARRAQKQFFVGALFIFRAQLRWKQQRNYSRYIWLDKLSERSKCFRLWKPFLTNSFNALIIQKLCVILRKSLC